MRKIFYMLISLVIISGTLLGQTFSTEEYKKFLKDNENLSSTGLYSLYPPGLYQYQAKISGNGILYLDSMQQKFNLTPYENTLISKNGFMVSERLSYATLWEAYEDVFNKDLPVYISTDAILHSVHKSYDAILKDIEKGLIIPRLVNLLQKFHDALPTLAEKYKSYPEMENSLKDYDLYFTVARNLMNNYTQPKYAELKPEVDKLLKLIEDKQGFVKYPLFSSHNRFMDFSQFQVRGHYDDPYDIRLAAYFKTMIWLGRSEFYLIAPKSDNDEQQDEKDIQRQIMDSYLVLETVETQNLWKDFDDIETIIRSMVGESDNVQLIHLKELLNETGFKSAGDFVKMDNCTKFQEALSKKPYADQKILSQILISSPFNPDQIKPASAFMLFGQRFVIDSYITGSVVYDKIIYNNQKIQRMLPSTLDVLFALGNSAAGDLLKPELDKYHYSTNMAGLRYLVDSYNSEFWSSSMFNSWLNLVRSLNSPSDEMRGKYPQFMQTAAWWQEKMNTQLASWAQLRHDNLLYAKQSYTGSYECSNPYGYLEPIPEFYTALSEYTANAKVTLNGFLDENQEDFYRIKYKINQYFKAVAEISDTMYNIAVKELEGTPLTDKENRFLCSVYSEIPGCVPEAGGGWFGKLFYNQHQDIDVRDYIVADIHTTPDDENGFRVGWVYHVGTGPFNLGIFIGKDMNGNTTAFAGPVLSYYEHISTNFKRLTDKEWDEIFTNNATITTLRPALVDLYLADKNGNSRSKNPVCLPLAPTGVADRTEAKDEVMLSAMPNPFSESALIAIRIPEGNELNDATVSIYDESGKFIKQLFRGSLAGGNFTMRWDGMDVAGKKSASGVYFIRLENDGRRYIGKVVLL